MSRYINDEIDRIVRENNRIKVIYITDKVVFKNRFKKIKAVCTCAIKGHQWELHLVNDSILYRGFDVYQCKRCGKTSFYEKV